MYELISGSYFLGTTRKEILPIFDTEKVREEENENNKNDMNVSLPLSLILFFPSSPSLLLVRSPSFLFLHFSSSSPPLSLILFFLSSPPSLLLARSPSFLFLHLSSSSSPLRLLPSLSQLLICNLTAMLEEISR